MRADTRAGRGPGAAPRWVSQKGSGGRGNEGGKKDAMGREGEGEEARLDSPTMRPSCTKRSLAEGGIRDRFDPGGGTRSPPFLFLLPGDLPGLRAGN